MSTQISIDGLLVNATNYNVEKKAKYFLYYVPQSDLDVIVPMGAYNRQHTLQLITTTDSESETLINILMNQTHTLIDVEGISHSVLVVSSKNESYGGKAGYYEFTIVFVENNG